MSAPAEPSAQQENRAETWLETAMPSVVATAAAVLLALAVGAVLIIFTDKSSLDALGRGDVGHCLSRLGESYWALISGAFGGGDNIATTLVRSAPLICAGLGVTIAFRAGLFNIGAQGQLIVASIACAYVGFSWDLPVGVHLVAALVAALVAGGLWGLIPGALKASTGAHEVITTMMLNYVAARILDFALLHNAFQRPGNDQPVSPKVAANALFPTVLGVNTSVVLAFLAAVAVWWLLERSTWGFEMRAVGANPNASRTAGMSIAKVTTIVMVLAGVLAGLAAVMQVQGHNDNLSTGTGGTIGFDAITVALLGRATPIGTVFAGLLFGALNVGGVEMQAQAGTPVELAAVLQALIVMFVAAPALVRSVVRIKIINREQTLAAKGWGG
ncbi:ABC transporter permease [Nocardioides montaniterrae]